MSPYGEQGFYGDGLLTPWFPVFRLQFETGCTDSRGFRANCFLIEHSARAYSLTILISAMLFQV